MESDSKGEGDQPAAFADLFCDMNVAPFPEPPVDPEDLAEEEVVETPGPEFAWMHHTLLGNVAGRIADRELERGVVQNEQQQCSLCCCCCCAALCCCRCCCAAARCLMCAAALCSATSGCSLSFALSAAALSVCCCCSPCLLCCCSPCLLCCCCLSVLLLFSLC